MIHHTKTIEKLDCIRNICLTFNVYHGVSPHYSERYGVPELLNLLLEVLVLLLVTVGQRVDPDSVGL